MFGDASGWLSPTLAALRGLGVATALRAFSWPEDLVVVHVGDLIDKGPDGDALVAWVDEAMARVPERWIQLVGNHEARFLGGHDFSGPYGRYEVADRTVATLRRWPATGRLRLGAALADGRGEEWLVTHAGLTARTWARLGSPASASDAASRLNRLLAADPAVAFQAGSMLGLPVEPGVVWAAADEVYRSWLTRPMPFSQMHGHTCPYSFSRQAWVTDLPEELRLATARATTEEDEANRHLRVPLGHRTVVGVDPSFGAYRPRRPLVPLLLDGEVLHEDDGQDEEHRAVEQQHGTVSTLLARLRAQTQCTTATALRRPASSDSAPPRRNVKRAREGDTDGR